jgi:hypothetical protein
MKKIQWKEGLSDEELSKYTIRAIVIGELNRGKSLSKETRDKLSKSLTGKPWNSDLKYTEAELLKIAKKYTRRQDFRKKDRNAYKAARSRGKDFFNKACTHMTSGKRVYGTYTIEELKKRAKKFKSRGDFSKYDRAGYIQARRMNVLDNICGHMKNLSSKITLQMANKIRKEYNAYVKKNGKRGALIPLVKKYKLAKSTISQIVNNQIWKK